MGTEVTANFGEGTEVRVNSSAGDQRHCGCERSGYRGYTEFLNIQKC